MERTQREQEVNPIERLRALAEQGDHIALAVEAETLYAHTHHEGSKDVAGEALFYCGFARGELGDRDGAIRAYETAAAIGFKPTGLLFNLGNAYREKFESNKALASYQEALAINPHRGDVIANMAFVYEDLGDIEKAEECYLEGARLFPTHNDAVCNASYSLLRRGEYQRGWAIYEGRRKTVPHPRLEPTWQAGESVAGRRIIVSVEQGYGDILMFGGLLTELSNEAQEVTLICDERMEALLRRSLGNIDVRSRFDPKEVDEADMIIGLASLGYLYRNVEHNHFRPIQPYLRVDEHRAEKIRQQVGSLPGKTKVGIAWRGGKDERNQRRRCINIHNLKPLLEIKDVCWINLQHHAPPEDLQQLTERDGITLHQVIDPTEDLDGLAAILTCLDDVVTVQQTLVHFAGACGTPAAVLIPAVPEWRYGMNGSSMPWWQSVELIRQSTLGQWDTAVDKARQRILDRVNRISC